MTALDWFTGWALAWVAVWVVVWVAASLGVALILSRVIRLRDRQIPTDDHERADR